MAIKDVVTLLTQIIALVGVALAFLQRFTRFETNTEAKLTQQNNKLDELKSALQEQKNDFDKTLAKFEADTKEQIKDLFKRSEDAAKHDTRIQLIESKLMTMGTQLDRIQNRVSNHAMPAVDPGHGRKGGG